MRAAVARTARPEVVGGIGGFAGLFDASKLAAYRRPLLATSTDGVGTKVMIAQRLGRYDTIGIDLVAMVADDLVVCGAEPLFMTDYLVFGKVIPERVAAVVARDRGRLRAGGLRAGRRGDGGAPRASRAGGLRYRGRGHGRRGGGRASRRGPRAHRRRRDRHGVLRAARQRVLARA